MNRKYTREIYLEKIKRLRNICPDIAISSDFIVGFPGETQDNFEQTLDLIDACMELRRVLLDLPDPSALAYCGRRRAVDDRLFGYCEIPHNVGLGCPDRNFDLSLWRTFYAFRALADGP